MSEKMKSTKIPTVKSCLCCDLKSGNIFVCRLEFLLNILGVIFTSFGGAVFFYAAHNDTRFSEDLDGVIRDTFYKFQCISYGLFLVIILSFLAAFSYKFLDGVKMNEPRNLLPYTFKNVFLGMILTTYGICFLSPIFFLGVAFVILAICNYSLFDHISQENERKLIISIINSSQQTTQNFVADPICAPSASLHDSVYSLNSNHQCNGNMITNGHVV